MENMKNKKSKRIKTVNAITVEKNYTKIPNGLWNLDASEFKIFCWLLSNKNEYTFSQYFMSKVLNMDYRTIKKKLFNLEKYNLIKMDDNLITISSSTNSSSTNNSQSTISSSTTINSKSTNSSSTNNSQSTNSKTSSSTINTSQSTNKIMVDQLTNNTKQDYKQDKVGNKTSTYSGKSAFDFNAWYKKKKHIIEDKLNLSYSDFRKEVSIFYNKNKDKYGNDYKIMVTDCLNHLLDNKPTSNNSTSQEPTFNYKTKYIEDNKSFNNIYQEFKLSNIIQPEKFEKWIIQDVLERFGEGYDNPIAIDVEFPKQCEHINEIISIIRSRARDIFNGQISLDEIDNDLNNPMITIKW